MAPNRPLGAVHAAALVVASMVGTGVFTITGELLVSLPSPALVLTAWAVSGLLALCGAAVYAELGTMMPRVGGDSSICRGRSVPRPDSCLAGSR